MTTTFERLCDILVRDHHLARDRLSLDAPLESLGIDSLGTVELLWNVEDTFAIQLPPEPVELSTLGDVVRYIDALVKVKAAGPAEVVVEVMAEARAATPAHPAHLPPLLHRP